MRVGRTILDLIGYTPLVHLTRLHPSNSAHILAKLEYLNPTGSIKDRIAKYMVEEAERRSLLRPGSRIVEATTGNMGISLAMVAAVKGYPMTVVMPRNMSMERQRILRAYGAEIIFTEGGESDVNQAIAKVEELAQADSTMWVPQQFSNPDNVTAHRLQTGREIWEETGGKLDAFVAGVGTGGTLTGVAQALREQGVRSEIIAVEPAECAILSGRSWGRHRIEGIGDGFVPPILDRSVVTEVIAVPDAEAIRMARLLAQWEGVFGGISAGANIYAALQVAGRLGPGKRVVTVIPDSGQRYLSTDLLRS